MGKVADTVSTAHPSVLSAAVFGVAAVFAWVAFKGRHDTKAELIGAVAVGAMFWWIDP